MTPPGWPNAAAALASRLTSGCCAQLLLSCPPITPVSELDAETQLEAFADATKVAIAADLDCWRNLCAKHRREPFPADPEHIFRYLRDLEKDGRKPATLARRIASLAAVHQIVGIKSDQCGTT
ncbi:MAG: hypothetical protein NVS3B5_05230 [Sphingomicrobium sp.]